MKSTQHTNHQAGALATFVIVGVVLLALVAGGVYFVKQRGQQVSGSDVAQTEQQKSDDSGDNKKPQDQTQNQNSDQSNSGEQQPAAPQNNSGNNQNNQSQNETQPKPAPNTGPSNVAATGPCETLMASTIGVTALTYYGVRYLQSRRELSKR